MQVQFSFILRFFMSIGSRLREERERIGLNQAQLGAVAGVQKQSQLKYENEFTFPNANYLVAVSKIGIDVSYVLFGTRANNALTAEEEIERMKKEAEEKKQQQQ